jgi:8-amino-7-oxononanoate synthase
VLDFTSALYLGFRHPSRSLRPWERLTTGVPAALAVPPEATGIARALAALQGCGAATVATSTLHVFWDLFWILGGDDAVTIHVDGEAYPIARWGIERAESRGVPVRTFSHHDPDALTHATRRGTRPVVVTDGFCPGCGRSAPLGAYVELVRRLGGVVVVDDTQALGVLGAGPGPAAPYGFGGGGSPAWHRTGGPELIVAASLAKGFGAPLAALSGAPEIVRRFEDMSETRVHASPPSTAALRAAEHALVLNRRRGDELRNRLARLVRHFGKRLTETGLSSSGGLFPVQTLTYTHGLDPSVVHRSLLERGVRTVLHKPRPTSGPRVSFLITARHSIADVDRALDALADATTPVARRLGGTP